METQGGSTVVVKMMAMGIVIIMLSVGIYGAWAAPANVNRFYGGGLSLGSGGEGFSIGSDTVLSRSAANVWSLGAGDSLIGATWLNSTNVSTSSLYINSDEWSAGDFGSIDITTTGDVTGTWINGTNVKGTNWYNGATNVDDLIDYPAQGPSYVIWTSGGNFYVKDGDTAQVDVGASVYSQLQAAINAIQAVGGILYFKSGTYALGTTQLEIYSNGMSIIGESETGTIFTYSGTAEALKIRSSSTRYTPVLKGFTVQAIGGATSSATATGILLENMSHANFENIKIMDFGAGTGLKIVAGNGVTSTLYGNYKDIWCYGNKYGMVLTGYSGYEVNCNTFTGLLIQCGSISGSVALSLNQYCTKNTFIGGDYTDAVTGLSCDGKYNQFINGRTESVTGTHLVLGTNSTSNKIDNWLFIGAGTYVSDTGTLNKFRDCPNYVTENSGTATLLNGNTTVVVTHGLSYTPSAKDISIVFTELPTNPTTGWMLGTFTSTQFTFTANDPGASNLDFSWSARKTP